MGASPHAQLFLKLLINMAFDKRGTYIYPWPTNVHLAKTQQPHNASKIRTMSRGKNGQCLINAATEVVAPWSACTWNRRHLEVWNCMGRNSDSCLRGAIQMPDARHVSPRRSTANLR
jgi:hypothetical protein